MDGIGASEGKRGQVARPGNMAAPLPPFPDLLLDSHVSFARKSSSFQKNDPHRFSAHLDEVYPLKTQKYGKGVC